MQTIYIFSGLGTDERVFQYIDFSGLSVQYIYWIEPLKKETIENYAIRLIKQITTLKPTLIGVSFGGIMAVEVGKLITTEKIILIASAKTKKEIPFYYRIAGALQLHKLLSPQILKYPNSFTYWFFGVTQQQDKRLLATILRDTNNYFLSWAINIIVCWKNNTEHNNLVHIHGTADRILPYRFIKNSIAVEEGDHFMTVTKAVLLTNTIRTLLASKILIFTYLILYVPAYFSIGQLTFQLLLR